MSRGKRITEAEFMYAKLAMTQGEKASVVAKKLDRNASYIREIIKKYPDYKSYLKAVSTRGAVRKTEPVQTKLAIGKLIHNPLKASQRIIYKPADAREGKEYRAIYNLMPLQRMSLKRKAAQWLAIIDDIENQEARHGRN
jgi:transposase